MILIFFLNKEVNKNHILIFNLDGCRARIKAKAKERKEKTKAKKEKINKYKYFNLWALLLWNLFSKRLFICTNLFVITLIKVQKFIMSVVFTMLIN